MQLILFVFVSILHEVSNVIVWLHRYLTDALRLINVCNTVDLTMIYINGKIKSDICGFVFFKLFLIANITVCLKQTIIVVSINILRWKWLVLIWIAVLLEEYCSLYYSIIWYPVIVIPSSPVRFELVIQYWFINTSVLNMLHFFINMTSRALFVHFSV